MAIPQFSYSVETHLIVNQSHEQLVNLLLLLTIWRFIPAITPRPARHVPLQLVISNVKEQLTGYTGHASV